MVLKDIRKFVPISKAVKQAVMDMYEDFGKVEARYNAWAIRGIKKLTNETLKSNKRYAMLNVNHNLNSAVLPPDFEEAIYVGWIDECGKKWQLTLNGSITNPKLIDEIPCDNQCDKQCDCYPKQLCCDLESTQVINRILINDTYYDETVTSTLLPSGEFYEVTTTPIAGSEGIEYITTKKYVTSFDVEECGCIKKTKKNDSKLKVCAWDQYTCYCTPCSYGDTDFGGYNIFPENNTIMFDGAMKFSKVYVEYRGGLPKKGNEYLIPEVTFETIINFTKFKSVENKKGVSLADRGWHWERYMIERGNMVKILGRISLSDVIHSALLVPKFDVNQNHCTSPRFNDEENDNTNIETIISPINPEPPMPPTTCNPTVITVEGSEMTGGYTYNNTDLAGLQLKIFADPFNRFLKATEFDLVPSGGFTILIGGPYTTDDFFQVMPNYCS